MAINPNTPSEDFEEFKLPPVPASQEQIEKEVEDMLEAIHTQVTSPEEEKMVLLALWRRLTQHPVVLAHLRTYQDEFVHPMARSIEHVIEDKPVHRGLLSRMRQAPEVTDVVRHEEIQTKRVDVHRGLLSRRKK